MLDELFKKRLLLITGKGGVGKSSLAAALSLTAAARGKNVLVAESDARGMLGEIFGSPVGYEPTLVAPGVYATNIDFFNALKGYVSEAVKVKRIIDLIFRNQIVRRFLDATPAARETALLFRLLALDEEVRIDKKPRYDLIIMDLPASGHAFSTLRTARTALNVFRTGPIFERASRVEALLNNPARTYLLQVAIPEEMAVNETIETRAKFLQEMQIPLGPIFVNMAPDGLFAHAEEQIYNQLKTAVGDKAPRALSRMIAASDVFIDRARRAEMQIERLSGALDQTPIHRLFEELETTSGQDLIWKLSAQINRLNSRKETPAT
jgi:anion-transporting  ArsA/GET3 family ATPase